MAIVMQSSKIIILKKGDYVTEEEVLDVIHHMIDYNISFSNRQLAAKKAVR